MKELIDVPRFLSRTTTPVRLRLIGLVVVVLGVASGLTSLVTVRQWSDLVHVMRGGGDRSAVSALDIYPLLSDADASAANAFLVGEPQRAAARARYENDIARAAAAITVASREIDDNASLAALATLSKGLPVYTGLVETARAIDRQGLPLGVTYLREASVLMRTTLLPAAQAVYEAANDRVASARSPATVFSWPVLALGLVTLGALLLAQVYLSRRTRRILNVWLVLATVAGLASVLWVANATAQSSRHVDAARRDGLGQVQLLARARIEASRGRADEALTLLARGSGQAFERDFRATMTTLIGADGAGGLLARALDGARDAEHRDAIAEAQSHARGWLTVHEQLRGLDEGGQYLEAVDMATGNGGAAFSRLEAALNQSLAHSTGRFDLETSRAVDDLFGADVAVTMMTGLLVLGVSVGLQQRIAEYR